MEVNARTELESMKAELRENDGNVYSESSVDESKHEHDEVHMDSMRDSSTSVVKIREAFFDSNIDIYLLANPYSGSREARAYTNLQSENYRFTLEEDNEVFLRI